jgi:hypothetical protein
LQEGLFENNRVIEFLARKASTVAGDVRAALKICQRAIEIYVEEKKELEDAEAVVGNMEIASEEEIMMLESIRRGDYDTASISHNDEDHMIAACSSSSSSSSSSSASTSSSSTSTSNTRPHEGPGLGSSSSSSSSRGYDNMENTDPALIGTYVSTADGISEKDRKRSIRNNNNNNDYTSNKISRKDSENNIHMNKKIDNNNSNKNDKNSRSRSSQSIISVPALKEKVYTCIICTYI